MNVLETYFEVSHPFGVAFAGLGRDYETTIAGVPSTIKLPRVKWSGDGNSVRADLTSPTWCHIPEDHDWSQTLDTHWPWGSPSSYSTTDREVGTAWVTHLGVTAQCADDLAAAQETATTLLDSLDDWWPAVCEWIEIITGQVHGIPRKTLVLGPHHTAWTAIHETAQRLYNKSLAVIHIVDVTGPGSPEDLTPGLFQTTLDRALEGPPPTEWLLIRDSRLALNIGSTRRAVIDAGTAAELAITKLIQDRLAGTSTVVIEALLDGHRMLSNRIVLLKSLGGNVAIPDGAKTGLVEPRNRATHRGVNPPGAEAREAIRIATEIVDAAYPLASYR